MKGHWKDVEAHKDKSRFLDEQVNGVTDSECQREGFRALQQFLHDKKLTVRTSGQIADHEGDFRLELELMKVLTPYFGIRGAHMADTLLNGPDGYPKHLMFAGDQQSLSS